MPAPGNGVPLLDQGVGTVNTYDPADGIVYLHLASEAGPYANPVVGRAAPDGLPAGQAPVVPYPPAETVTTERHRGSPAPRVGARDLRLRTLQRKRGD
jgi:hypothetical protein